MDADRFITHSLRDARLTNILRAALDAVEPGRLVRDCLWGATLPAHDRLFLLGIGKAAEAMTLSATDVFPSFTEALIITKQVSSGARDRVTFMEAAHPVPDVRSIMAGRAALSFVSGISQNDLLICLISGGGSSLVTAPQNGLGLRDIQLITTSLLGAGAGIEEINTVRRHLDRIKGGGLAGAAKCRILSLLLSDVIGDRLEAIASGPTAPDPTSAADALAILDRYEIPVSSNIYAALSSQPSSDRSIGSRVANRIIGNNATAAQAAFQEAQLQGLDVEIVDSQLTGEARLAGSELAARLRNALTRRQRPFCLLAGGETTVTLHGDGKGGRNQELALAAVDALDGLTDVFLIAFATDGDDGPTDAAGAVVTGQTRVRAHAAGMNAAGYLARNDAYHFFEPLGDLLKPGYTGTNVNDLIFLIAL